MAVNESVSVNKMTNFALPSPKRHRKYEETGTIHDEVMIPFGDTIDGGSFPTPNGFYALC